MILSAEELAKIVKEVVSQLLKLSEAQEIAFMEKVDQKVSEALNQHLDDFKHEERQLDEREKRFLEREEE